MFSCISSLFKPLWAITSQELKTKLSSILKSCLFTFPSFYQAKSNKINKANAIKKNFEEHFMEHKNVVKTFFCRQI